VFKSFTRYDQNELNVNIHNAVTSWWWRNRKWICF